MNVQLQIQDFGKLQALMNALGPSNRKRLNAVGAKRLEAEVRHHVAMIAPSRHRTANALGGKKTGHYYPKGLRGIVGHATADRGEVLIKIAGISRAFHDVDIKPVRAKLLTIPINAVSYGHTVKELEKRGWKFFRPKKNGKNFFKRVLKRVIGKNGRASSDILFGYKGKGKRRVVKPLFVLKKSVHQIHDPSLLPTPDTCARVVSEAMTRSINERIRNAH